MGHLLQRWPADQRLSSFTAISADGHTVAFSSLASNLVLNDTSARYDVTVRH
jgi:hypothetical protein